MPGLIAKLSHFLFRTHCCHCESVMAIGAINQHYSWFNSSSLQEDWLREEIKLRIVVSMLPLKGYWYNGTPVPEVRRVYSRVSVSLVAVCLADSKPESVWRLSVKGAVMDWDIVGRFCDHGSWWTRRSLLQRWCDVWTRVSQKPALGVTISLLYCRDSVCRKLRLAMSPQVSIFI
jgi:hypothetical protein